MQYIALLRWINVGGNKKVEMKKVRELFQVAWYSKVSTYLNSGNILFESTKKSLVIQKEIESLLEREFGFKIQTLVKTKQEIHEIVSALPKNWENDDKQKSDIAFLFPEIDSAKTIDMLPIKKEYVDIYYVPGAIYRNIDRKNYNKSQLNKIAGNKVYQYMTVRNINTARALATKKR